MGMGMDKGEKYNHVLNPALSESSILKILAILLSDFQQEREGLLNKLKKLGVKV
jgi:hypothetical protein